METAPQTSPEEVAALKAALAVSEARRRRSDAELALAKAMASDDKALIAHQALRIAKLERQVYGPRKERHAQLVDQMTLELEELNASATEDELAAEIALAKTTDVAGFTHKRPETRTTFPEHLPRERVVIDPPCACERCGGMRLRKLGEDVTKTLETIPRSWKVIETVREKFTCRDCEAISQAPAPFHVIPRGWAGPSLLAMILYEEVRRPSAAQPPVRALRPRGRSYPALHRRRRGRSRLSGAGACLRARFEIPGTGAIAARAVVIQARDVDRAEPWPDGQDRQEDQALPV
jgi:transposase